MQDSSANSPAMATERGGAPKSVPAYMLAGAPDHPEINLATGQVSLSRELFALQAGPDIEYGLQISYNSNTANQVETWNLDAPSGVVGFGWHFSRDQIIMMMDSSTMLPRYAMSLQGNMVQFKRNGVEKIIEREAECFVTEPYHFWKIRFMPALEPENEGWLVTLDNGLVYHFGNTRDSVELGVRSGNYYGDGKGNGTDQKQLGVVWNLSKIEDQWGNAINFGYEQYHSKLGMQGKEFTRSCRLTGIKSSDGRSIELTYDKKEKAEFEKPHVPFAGDPVQGLDAYEDRYEENYLSAATLYSARREVVSQVKLQYLVGLLGDSESKTIKRTLSQIQRFTGNEDLLEQPELFDYYTYYEKIHTPFNGGFYGALKSVTSPEGAVVSYQYRPQHATGCPLDIEISRPDPEYKTPSAYYGPNYVVVGWTKQIDYTSYKCRLTVYTWLGYWAVQSVGEVPYSEEFSVLPGSNFFTVVSDDPHYTLSLVAQDIREPAEWSVKTYTSKQVPANRLVSNGLDFVAIVKPAGPARNQLVVYSREGGSGSWKPKSFNLPPLLTDGVRSQYCLDAQGETIFTAMCPLPSRLQSGYVKIKMFARNKAGEWTESSVVTGPEISVRNNGVSLLQPYARTSFGSSFVGLQVALVLVGGKGGQSQQWQWQHYACDWKQDLSHIGCTHIKTLTESTSHSSCHMRAVDHALHIDLKKNKGEGRKFLYRFLGSTDKGVPVYTERKFNSSGADNQFYYGPDSCTIDHNKKSHFWSLDLYDNQWKEREVKPFKDDAPAKSQNSWNLFLDIWEGVSYMLIAAPIPLVGELSLLAFELTLVGVDQYLSLRSTGPEGFHAGSNYFSAHHAVWHQETNGSYTEIGSLLGKDEKLESQYTQAASDYIAYSVKNKGTFVQMLKNGGFRGHRIPVTDGGPRGGSMQRFWLGGVGPHCLLSWNNAKNSKELPEAMRLARIVDGRLQGHQSCYCVSRVIVDDGFRKLYTNYQYDESTALPRGLNGMQFGAVTTLYQGDESSPPDASGKRVSQFFAWKDGGYQRWVLNGTQYAEEIYDQSGAEIQSWTERYEIYEPLPGHPDVFYVRPTTRTITDDGCVRKTVLDYSRENGRVNYSTIETMDVTGKNSTYTTQYTYAFENYREIKNKNMLNGRCQVQQTIAYAKDGTPAIGDGEVWTKTGITATPWGPDPSGKDIMVPLASYLALESDAEFDFATNSPKDGGQWNQTEQAHAWDPTTGQVVEVQTFPATGVSVTSSNLMDVTGELTLATFQNASAVANECGYYGFGGDDRTEDWDVSPTSIKRLSKKFAPRTDAPGYLVSAYFRFQPNQKSGTYPQLGFGSHFVTVNPDLQWQWQGGTDRWQYAEYYLAAPTSTDLPFANFPAGSDTIRGFRFGPIDAPFSAARYDALLREPLSTLDGNGFSQTTLLDYRQRPSAMISGDGGVIALQWTADAIRTPDKNGFVPSQAITLVARSGGPYLAMTDKGAQNYKTSYTNAALQLAIPDRNDVAINFTVTFAGCSVQCKFDAKDSQGAVTLDNADGAKRITNPGAPVTQKISGRPRKFAVWFAPQHLWVWLDDAPCVDVALGVAGTGAGQLSVSDQNALAGRDKDDPRARLRDVCVAFDPIASASTGNGIGQVIQNQTQGDDAKTMVYRQTFFNRWGAQEIQTKPNSAAISGPWSYLSTCASFDESTGKLSGDVVKYYQQHSQSDAPYAYSRIRGEANAMARAISATLPGEEFQTAGKGETTFLYGTQNEYASALLKTLGLSDNAGAFNAVTSLRKIGSYDVPQITLTNQSGQVVATAHGKQDYGNQQVETALTTFPEGARSTVVTPPGGTAYATTAEYSFWGTSTESKNSDTGTTQYMSTYAGQLRFVQRDGATVIVVYKYDRLGRMIEQGELTKEWSELNQKDAQNPDYPSSGDGYAVRIQMSYDVDPRNPAPNFQGRLRNVVTNASGPGSDETTQTFTYDRQGRVLSTDLTVSAFDGTARRTTYAYDWMGNLQTLTYPGGGFGLNYSYTASGRLADIKDASSGVVYASYSYTLGGAIEKEYLSNSTWLREFTYSFQGAVDTIAFYGPPPNPRQQLFLETLSYESGGKFLGGNVAVSTIVNLFQEKIIFNYDSQGRLSYAEYSGSGPWGKWTPNYDLRNNLTKINDAQSPQYPPMSASFVDGTNRIKQTTVYDDGKGNSGPQKTTDYVYTTDGKVVANSLTTSTQYDAVLQQATSSSPRNSSYKKLSFQYNGAGARRVLKVITPSQGSAQSRLYLHGVQSLPLREIDQTPGKNAATTDYIYGIAGLMAIRQGSTLSFVVADHLGSTRATVVSSNPTQFKGTAFYDVFGTLDTSVSTINTKSIRYLYTGQEYDSELGMHNYRRRLYDPTVSAFLSDDPLKQDYSPYAYVAGNPVNFTDPTGMMLRPFRKGKSASSPSSGPSPSLSPSPSPSPSPTKSGLDDEFTLQLSKDDAYLEYAHKSGNVVESQCYHAAVGISDSLGKQSIDHRIVAMVLWRNPSQDVPHTHFVVAARRKNNIRIIDPTAQQFSGLEASISSPREWFNRFRSVNRFGIMQGFEDPAAALRWSEKAFEKKKNPVPLLEDLVVVGPFWNNKHSKEKESFIFGPIIRL